jgi:hypothetical protein
MNTINIIIPSSSKSSTSNNSNSWGSAWGTSPGLPSYHCIFHTSALMYCVNVKHLTLSCLLNSHRSLETPASLRAKPQGAWGILWTCRCMCPFIPFDPSFHLIYNQGGFVYQRQSWGDRSRSLYSAVTPSIDPPAWTVILALASAFFF